MGEPRKPKEQVTDFALLETEFRKYLDNLLETIFNPAIAFTQTGNEDQCSYCDFKELCRK